jgi:hypothetical protein
VGKIISILFFYKLRKYLKKQKKNNSSHIVYWTIKNYYNSQLKGKNLSYLFKAENYIKFIFSNKSSKPSITNLFLKKWFYLKING